MLFEQLLDDDLGCASYLVGDERAGVAVVVDPPYHVEPLLAAAEENGIRISAVLETHTHADHVSGHGRLALEHGVPIRIHGAAGATFPHEPLEDGTEIEVGDVVLRAIHTPGHRPEHCCFSVTDRSRGDEPWLVLTGDSLFVGDAGRPDLAVDAKEGAEGLFHSLRRLLELGDGVEVFPGHVAGSLCGAAMGSKPSTTIGYERRFNPALQGELADFLGAALGPQPPRPPNMERIVELNRGELVGAQPPLERVDAPPKEAIVLDVRPTEDFAAGHHPGAVGIPIAGSSFATKAAFVLPERAVVVHATDEAEAVRAARALHAVGLFGLAGWQEGGGDERLEPVSLEELERMLADDAVELLDVREADERDEGHIPGSRHLPYRTARGAAEAGLLDGRPVVTICESGPRAAVAASVLQAAGVDARPVLDGGVAAWQARGGETTSFRRCGGRRHG
ncbi:MAG TPA: rhodanese-like domain-containing protein [Gaiellaceae bacterium]|nr:rhodanese-like domain-containing protein [Gaiellaceae bacterium]